MDTVNLTVESREKQGTSNANRLRREGMIPAVVYGGDNDPRSIVVSAQVFMKETRDKRSSQMYSFVSESKDLNGQLALIKDVQIDTLKQTVMHVDFQEISLGKPMLFTIRVDVVGEPESVKQGLATVNHILHELEIECLPKEIPDAFQVDISGLELGETLHVSDITMPSGSTLKTNAERSVVSIQEKVEEVIEEPAEGEAPAAGDAPAEGEAKEGGESSEAPAE